jgi:hypothetical protein
MPLEDPRRAGLEARELSLVLQNSKGWAGPLRQVCKKWTFRRGLVESVRLTANHFFRHREELLAWAPIREVELMHAGNVLDELAECETLRRLSGLGIAQEANGMQAASWRHSAWMGYELSPRPWLTPNQNLALSLQEQMAAQLHMLFRSPHLINVRRLSLDGVPFGVPGAAVLAGSPLAEQLQNLALAHTQLSLFALSRLSASGRLSELRRLQFECCNSSGSGDDPQQGFVTHSDAFAPLLANLQSLSLRPWPLTLGQLDEISLAAAEVALESLHLSGAKLDSQDNSLGAASIMMLDQMALWRELRVLDLSDCRIDLDLFASLISSPRLRNLRRLSLDGVGLGAAGAEAVARSPHAERLTHLSLRRILQRTEEFRRYRIEDEIVRQLVSSNRLTTLSALCLASNALTIESVTALVDSPLLEQLHILDLSDNYLGEESAALLVRHGAWPRLAWLDLRGNRFVRPVKDALKRAFGFRVLV